MSEGEGVAIFLFSGLSNDQIQTVNTRRLESALESKKVVFQKVNGSDPAEKDFRDKLFGVSGVRGKYPQLFIQHGEGESATYEFIGLWEQIESLLDCDDLPADVIAANPQVKTFSNVS
jgi:hypothetical protein